MSLRNIRLEERNMTLNYRFHGDYFDYRVEYDRYLVALHNILNQETKESLITLLINSDHCVLGLKEDFKEELYDYFKEEAYKIYKDRRCE